MKIAIIFEGKTEKAFLEHLRTFLKNCLDGKMPKLVPRPYDGRIPKNDKLKRAVEKLLDDGAHSVDAVIALTDVYTGTTPPDFTNATDAKNKMRQWVGKNDKFYPHAAQYDFEAWLLPYWDEIKKLSGKNFNRPRGNPEDVNHTKPPAHRIIEVFDASKRKYVKQRDANRILSGKDLLVSANECPELKAFLNTILQLCGGDLIK